MTKQPFFHDKHALAIAVCAGALSLVGSPTTFAQDSSDSSARGGLQKPQSGAKSNTGAESEQKALEAAHKSSIDQARALEQLAAQEREGLDHQDVGARVQRLGQSVEDSRQHLASLEAVSKVDEKTREQFDEIREKHDEASEAQRALLQQVNNPELTQARVGQIENDAKEIVDDMKDAESERKKLATAQATAKEDSSAR
jgi:hypothetical protein